MLRREKCVCCANDEAEVLYVKNGFEICRCRECGHIFVADPLAIDTAKLYTGEFFDNVYGNYDQRADVYRKTFKNYLKIIQHYVQTGNLLELGCGFGHFLDVCRGSFRAIGMDLADQALMQARAHGHNAIQGDYLDRSFSEPFNVIVMWDFIEHIPKPDEILMKACGNWFRVGISF
ncbi:MAG: class I SAM-dependent methyltransferase [Lentisphaerae bacterium]|nr:class I SAM-dependent methyltransferase [Lentisphaerota bacterium]